jgi:hypothetical protein
VILAVRKTDNHMEGIEHPDLNAAASRPKRKCSRIRHRNFLIRIPALSGTKFYFFGYRLEFRLSSSGVGNRMSRSCASCITSKQDYYDS